jgi:hypothetical protein
MGKHAKNRTPASNAEIAAWAGRLITNLAGREDPETLPLLLAISDLARDEYRAAGQTLYEAGIPLAQLAAFMTEAGHQMSKQAAQQQFSAKGRAWIQQRNELQREQRRNRSYAAALLHEAAAVAHRAANVVGLADFAARRRARQAAAALQTAAEQAQQAEAM